MGTAGLANLKLDESVSRLAGISDKRSEQFSRIGIKKNRDLLNLFPYDYLNLEKAESLSTCKTGQLCTIVANIEDIQLKNPKPDVELLEVALSDGTDSAIATFFSKRWIAKKYTVGMKVIIQGKLEFKYGFKRFTNPTILQLPENGSLAIAEYNLPPSLSQQVVCKAIRAALEHIKGTIDYVPGDVRDHYKLMPLMQAYRQVHFPKNINEAKAAIRTLKFNELYIWQIFRILHDIDTVENLESKLSNFSLVDYILKPYTKGTQMRTTEVIQSSCMDDVFAKAYDALDAKQQVVFLCPLIGIDGKERNFRAGNYSNRFNNFKHLGYLAITSNCDWEHDNSYAALSHCKMLQRQNFSNYEIDVISGKQATKDKQAVADFASKKIDVLICTKSNFDVFKNDNLGAVIVEDSDRFSLLQLNHIRAALPENCKFILINNSKNKQIIKRLELLQQTSDVQDLTHADINFLPAGRQLPSYVEGADVLKLVNVESDNVMAGFAALHAIQKIEDDPKLSKSENSVLSYEESRQFK